MKLDVKNINNYTKQLKISVKWDDLKSDYESEFDKFKSNYTPPGGRKGKVFGQALKLFKKNYTPSIGISEIQSLSNDELQTSANKSNSKK